MVGRLSAVTALALALALILAGCSGLAPGSDDARSTGSLTPAPVPEEGADHAPGLTSDGVEAPERLADAHAASLSNRSYRLVVNRTIHHGNGTLRERLLLDLRLAADRSFLVDTATAGPAAPVFIGTPPADATFWSNGSVYTRRLTRDGRTTYTSFQPSSGAGTWRYWARTVPFGGRQASPRAFIERTFASVPTRVAGRRTTNDTAVYRVVGDRATGPLPEVDEVGTVDLRATVTADGLVRSLSLTYVGTVDGERVTVRRTVRYEGVGNTSVGRPAWTDRALDQS